MTSAHRNQNYFSKSLPLLAVFFLLVSGFNAQAETKKMPEFNLPGVNNSGQINSADFEDKVLIVYFWATWCPLCRKETKDFVELTKTYKGKDLQIIGISLDKRGESAVLRFMDKMQINYPIAMATPKVKADFGPITGIPAIFIIDKKGNIVKKKLGYIPHKQLLADIDALLTE
jgi:peroxiredoxin